MSDPFPAVAEQIVAAAALPRRKDLNAQAVSAIEATLRVSVGTRGRAAGAIRPYRHHQLGDSVLAQEPLTFMDSAIEQQAPNDSEVVHGDAEPALRRKQSAVAAELVAVEVAGHAVGRKDGAGDRKSVV